ncbi:MAG: uroporphyrinogen decarboxylase family protein [Candidatus Omnitrophota bacterium]
MKNGQPDMVPVAPDTSNMIPCKLTGKPFWDIYLYQDPPLWKAYIDTVKYFGFDGWLPSIPNIFEKEEPSGCKKETVVVFRSEERIITREYTEKEKNGKEWSPLITVYYRSDPPTILAASKLGMEESPRKYEPIEGIKEQKKDLELLKEIKGYMGNKGVVGIHAAVPSLDNPEVPGSYSVYDYYDRCDEVKKHMEKAGEETIKRLGKILSSPVRPDFIFTGASGLLIFNTPAIFRDLGLSTLKKITKMCKEAGIPSQIHCCGPERALVEMCAEETDLSSINPLEIPPMGDCNLKEIKERFGKKISFMGNLHTTKVMLKGTTKAVAEAARKAMDDAAKGGGFILSTGDQCGRDTPEENIFKMIDTAKTYGKY